MVPCSVCLTCGIDGPPVIYHNTALTEKDSALYDVRVMHLWFSSSNHYLKVRVGGSMLCVSGLGYR